LNVGVACGSFGALAAHGILAQDLPLALGPVRHGFFVGAASSPFASDPPHKLQFSVRLLDTLRRSECDFSIGEEVSFLLGDVTGDAPVGVPVVKTGRWAFNEVSDHKLFLDD
jgi:hypothetical protein